MKGNLSGSIFPLYGSVNSEPAWRRTVILLSLKNGASASLHQGIGSLSTGGWGLAAASPITLLLAVVLAVFFELKSRREEAWLSERYADYAAYMQQTRRFFPGLY